MTPLLIYVAGPLSAPTEVEKRRNVRRAMIAGRHLIARGHWPFIPHLTDFYDAWHEIAYDEPMDPETYMQWDFAILRRCDGLVYLDSSPGADRELALAKELGLTIWRHVNEVPYA